MSFNDFTLIPPDDPVSADQAVASAVGSALAASDPVSAAPVDAPATLGRSWVFDFSRGQFVRQGRSPGETRGVDTLAQWCLMALYTSRGADAVFSDDFGTDEPDSLVGYLLEDEIIADWRAHIVEALMVHDRVTSVENLVLDWDPRTGVLTIVSLEVVTDDAGSVALADVSVKAGG